LTQPTSRRSRTVVVHSRSLDATSSSATNSGDDIFSVNDTTAWYAGLQAGNGGDASSVARFFRVPGMAHCGGGPSTDRFDMLAALVEWVEIAPLPCRSITDSRHTCHSRPC
jgi:hypothetical protein